VKSTARWAFVIAAAAGISLFVVWRLGRVHPPIRWARAAQKALRDGRSDEARQLARRALGFSRHRRHLLSWRPPKWDFESGRLEDALGHLEMVTDDGTSAALKAVNLAGEVALSAESPVRGSAALPGACWKLIHAT